MVTVYFTSAIRQRTGDYETTIDYAGDVQGLLRLLANRYGPQLAEALTSPQSGGGGLPGYVNIYVDGTDIRHLQALATPVGADATVDLVPAVSGG